MKTIYIERIEKLQKKIKKQKLDAILIINRINTFYLTGFKGSLSYTLITPETGYLFTDSRYIEYAENNVHGIEVKLLDTNFKKTFKSIIKSRKISTIGFEGSIVYNEYERFRNMCNGANFSESSKLIYDMRIIKSEQEIKFMRESIRNNDEIFSEIVKDIKVGKKEISLAKKLKQLMEKGDRGGECFSSIVAVGANTAMPHCIPGNYKIQENDFVLLDFGVKCNDYGSDMTRTIVAGTPEKEQKKIYDIVLTAQQKAIDFIKPGVKAKDADKVARDYIEKKGFGGEFGHGLGHGIGLECHEGPRLSPLSKDTLKEGMIVTVEPGIYIPQFGGVRIEDIVLITADGCEVLSSSPKAITVS